VLVLPVGLSVVTDDPVGIGRRGTSGVRRGNLSVQRIVQALEETLSQVHITDGINGLGEVDATRKLSIAVAPVVLNTFEMPLIYDHNDFFSFALIDLLEKILITLINKDLLQSGEEDVCTLSVPVDEMLIKAFLGESLRICLSDLLTVGTELLSVETLSVLEALEEVMGYIHTGLMIKTVGSLAV